MTACGYYIDEFKCGETADIFLRDGWKELSYVGTYSWSRADSAVVEAALLESQVAGLPDDPPGPATSHPRVFGWGAAISRGRLFHSYIMTQYVEA